LTLGGRVGFQVENALAAAAACWALDLSPETTRAGLASFDNSLEKIPGRFNLLEIGGATVIVDYGHNPSALAALIDALESFPHERRTIVYSAAGDRRDDDMIRQGQQLGAAFDRVILFEGDYTRGRPDGETMALLRRGLAAGLPRRVIEEIHGAIKAVEAALRSVGPGDLLLIQADIVDETIDLIRRHQDDRDPGPSADMRDWQRSRSPPANSTRPRPSTPSDDRTAGRPPAIDPFRSHTSFSSTPDGKDPVSWTGPGPSPR
jgi:cyanophycin synthetase